MADVACAEPEREGAEAEPATGGAAGKLPNRSSFSFNNVISGSGSPSSFGSSCGSRNKSKLALASASARVFLA